VSDFKSFRSVVPVVRTDALPSEVSRRLFGIRKTCLSDWRNHVKVRKGLQNENCMKTLQKHALIETPHLCIESKRCFVMLLFESIESRACADNELVICQEYHAGRCIRASRCMQIPWIRVWLHTCARLLTCDFSYKKEESTSC
jgi:hypothetical protein